MTTSEDLLAKKKVIGIDVDGVIANFNPAYIRLLSKFAGRSAPVDADTYEPQTWSYEGVLGFTPDHVTATWKYITVDPMFWATLKAYPACRMFLDALKRSGHDIYFITSRPGLTAKRQTESWLRSFGYDNPTVLISSYKGLACRALLVDAYVDDRIENCLDVAATGAAVYMPRRGWNRIASDSDSRIVEVDSIYEMLDAEAIPYDEHARTSPIAQAA